MILAEVEFESVLNERDGLRDEVERLLRELEQERSKNSELSCKLQDETIAHEIYSQALTEQIVDLECECVKVKELLADRDKREGINVHPTLLRQAISEAKVPATIEARRLIRVALGIDAADETELGL